ncbi:Glu-tRNA(Gln) amidotransferase subunit GatD [Candidatus Woesearchaeota archaeon]|nr:Glu-tRNA(Gln) amidotransferase subunit GatD [Candidatus Woesearchaeota archaeon]
MTKKSLVEASSGDVVKITTTDSTYEGILMPQQSKTSTFIKLNTGYNIGINNTTIKTITLIKKAIEKQEKTATNTLNPQLKTIAVLHTGGTIASKVDYATGAVTAKFSVHDLLSLVPELKTIANITTKQVANMMSENMRFPFYKTLADAISEQIKQGVNGIIIGHGTDTLQFTAVALSFMFENLAIPVLIVGSQRSTDRGSTDAAMNLICAAQFIAHTDFKGIGICMHDTTNDEYGAILPATKTKKMHTSRRDAFKAINDTPIAKVHMKTGKVEYLKQDYCKEVKGKLEYKPNFEDKVGIVKVYPNMLPEIFDFYREKKYKGLIIEGTGLGHMPIYIHEAKDEIINAVKKLINSGCIVVMSSQAIFGKVMMDVYSNLRKEKEIGIIEGNDMLTETAFIKLAWLLGNYKPEEVKQLMTENLRGEINSRISVDEYIE